LDQFGAVNEALAHLGQIAIDPLVVVGRQHLTGLEGPGRHQILAFDRDIQAYRPAPNLAGQVLSANDYKWVDGDLSKMGESLIDSPELIQDMELSRAQQPGNALRLNDFRQMSVIKLGDQVRVAILGRGFAIDASGQALADAATGASVKVRISDGKIIQGTAVKQGLVEVVME